MLTITSSNGNIIIKTVDEYMEQDGLSAELAYIARKVDLYTAQWYGGLKSHITEAQFNAMQKRLGW